MRNILIIMAWAVCSAALGGGTALGQEQPAAAGAANVEALKQRRAELEKQAAGLQKQLSEIRGALAKDGEVAAAGAAMDAAQKGRDQKRNSAPGVVAARKARDEARAGAEKAMADAVAADAEGGALVKRVAEATAAESVDAEKEKARGELRELTRRMAKDPALAAQVEQLQKMEVAYRAAGKSDPSLVQAAQAVNAAQKALEEKIRTLPERQALEQAQKAYDAAYASSAAVKSAREARDAASKSLETAARARAEASPEGGELVKKIAAAEQKEQQAKAQRAEAEQKLSEVRRRIRKAAPAALTQANQALDEAERAYREVSDRELKGETEALAAARKAYEEKIAQKLAADPKAGALIEQIKQIEEQSRSLGRQIRESQGR